MLKFHDANVPFYLTQHPKPNKGQAHRYLTNGHVMMVCLPFSLLALLALLAMCARSLACLLSLTTYLPLKLEGA